MGEWGAPCGRSGSTHHQALTVVHYPVSGPSNSPLQSTQAQSPSMKDMGSPQIGQSGGGPLSIRGRIGSSISSSSIFTPLEMANLTPPTPEVVSRLALALPDA